MSGKLRWTGGPAPLWSCPPPPPRVKKYDRLKIGVGPATEVVIVSSRLEETRTHYVDARTVPCTGDVETCWVDHRDHGAPRYSAWLAVKFPKINPVWLLSLTPVAIAIEPRLRQQDLDLAGLTLKVWRIGGHERSEMHALLLVDGQRVPNLPTAPDIRFCLQRMWAAEDRPARMRSANPGPVQRAAVAASKGGEA